MGNLFTKNSKARVSPPEQSRSEPGSEVDSIGKTSGDAPALTRDLRRRVNILAMVLLGLAGAFAWPLYHWIRFSLHSSLYSYTLLVPFVSVFLIRSTRPRALETSRPAPGFAVALGAIGLSLLTINLLHPSSALQDRLCVWMLAFVLLVWSSCALIMGIKLIQQFAFPIAFLIFLAPLPVAVENRVEAFLQHSSAEAAYQMISLVGTPIYKSGTLFQMPGMSIEVAPECSGIHSSLVLFITALIAAHLLFRNPSAKWALVLLVIPLGILRNGFRVFTLVELSLHVNANIIDSPLHHKGGPIFFLISLIPFFLLAWLLLKFDRRRKPDTQSAACTAET